MFLHEVVTQSKVSDLDLVAASILSPEHRVDQAIEAMRQQKSGSVLICDGAKLVGIFTERDLLRLLGAGTPTSVLLSGAMTRNPHTVTLNDSLLTVLRLMDEGGYRRIPVINGGGHPAGVIDTSTVVHFLVEHFPTGVYNQASERLQTAREREGA